MNKVIKKEDWKVSVWAGGTTNEIFIYPEDSLQLRIMEKNLFSQNFLE